MEAICRNELAKLNVKKLLSSKDRYGKQLFTC